jgi:hypothetical protein
MSEQVKPKRSMPASQAMALMAALAAGAGLAAGATGWSSRTRWIKIPRGPSRNKFAAGPDGVGRVKKVKGSQRNQPCPCGKTVTHTTRNGLGLVEERAVPVKYKHCCGK